MPESDKYVRVRIPRQLVQLIEKEVIRDGIYRSSSDFIVEHVRQGLKEWYKEHKGRTDVYNY